MSDYPSPLQKIPMIFEEVIGIDYSGAKKPDSELPSIRVFSAKPGQFPEEIFSQSSRHWSRITLANWLIQKIQTHPPILIGIDHALSFPYSWFKKNAVPRWNEFLNLAVKLWPTDQSPVHHALKRNPLPHPNEGFRTTDLWTQSAKSLFLTSSAGTIAFSTLAGLPWLRKIQTECRGKVHFWPMDGLRPAKGQSVIAEIYPTLWRRRFREKIPETFDEHQRDAFVATAWLQWANENHFLERYWIPPLKNEELEKIKVEGWILGVG